MLNIRYIISKIIKKAHLPAIKDSKISHKSRVCTGAHVVGTEIGDYSYIGNFSTILDTKIGKYCSIADNCIIGGKAHPVSWVTTSPVAYAGKNCLGINYSENNFNDAKETIIENDVWIGNNALIKAGVTLSTGCIIGMGSVITKNVGPYEVWGGNPAKLLKKRFSDEIIRELILSRWWDESEELLHELGNHLNNPNEFLYNLNKYRQTHKF